MARKGHLCLIAGARDTILLLEFLENLKFVFSMFLLNILFLYIESEFDSGDKRDTKIPTQSLATLAGRCGLREQRQRRSLSPGYINVYVDR